MDCRDEIISKVTCSLSDNLSGTDLYQVKIALTVALKDYKIEKQCTEVSTIDYESDFFVKQFLATLKTEGRSNGTIHQYAYAITKFHDFINKPLKEVGAYDVRVWLAIKLDGGAKESTVNNYRACLSSFYKWMSVEEIIRVNPMDKIKLIKEPVVEKKEFSDVDISNLRDACKNTRERAIIEFLLSSGVRISEFCNLKISDINPTTLEISIHHGKGGKDRTTMINEVAYMWLQKYINERNCDSIYLFTQSIDRSKKNTPSGIAKMLNKIAARGCIKNVHPHRFRRTFATTLFRRGMDPASIQILMGHANINQTMEYISIRKSDVIGQFKKVS